MERPVGDLSMRAPSCIFAVMSTLLWHSCLLSAFAWAAEGPDALSPSRTEIPTWTQVRAVPMQGDWRIFWNVGGGDVAFNNGEALAHGFRLVNLLNTYSDYHDFNCRWWAGRRGSSR